MIDPVSLDFIAGAAGAVVIAPATYFAFRSLRRRHARRRVGLRPSASRVTRRTRGRSRPDPAAPVVGGMLEGMETRLAITWAEFRRRYLRGG